MKRIKHVVHGMNDYFFDIDPEEAPDYVGASIFYGAMAVIVLAGVILLVATFNGA